MALDENGGGAGDSGAGGGDAAALLGAGGGDAGAAGSGASGGQGDQGDQGGQGDQGDQSIGGAADPDWYQHIPAEPGEGEKTSLRDWIKAAGVKDLAGLAKVARDNQAALRDSGRIKVPGEGASAEEVAAFRSAIGVPADPSGYSLPELKDAAGNAVPLDQGIIGKLLPKAIERGVPAQAMNGLIADFVQLQMDDVADADTRQQQEADAWTKEQGQNLNSKLAAVNSAAKALDLSSEDLIGLRATLGAGKTLSMLARLGEGMAEDVLITGGKGRFGVSGAEAQVQLDQLKQDRDFQRKVGVPGSPESVRWNRLIDAVAAEEERKMRAG